MTVQEERELNEWLATEVMGWEIQVNTQSYSWAPGHIVPLLGEWWVNTEGGTTFLKTDFNPLHNISQCFEYLVPKMNDCLHLKEHGEKGTWSAMFCASTIEWSNADTPESAICLACKKAWEGEK